MIRRIVHGTQKKYTKKIQDFDGVKMVSGGTRWRSWLRHCATSRKVAGSIPDGVIEFFH